MAVRHSTEFKAEAVRMIRSSGLNMRQVSKDLGVGYSTLAKWKSEADDADLRAGPHEDKDKEIARLRRELQLVTEEREILKKATMYFAGQK